MLYFLSICPPSSSPGNLAESTQRIQKYFIVLEEHGSKFPMHCTTVKGSVRLFFRSGSFFFKVIVYITIFLEMLNIAEYYYMSQDESNTALFDLLHQKLSWILSRSFVCWRY